MIPGILQYYPFFSFILIGQKTKRGNISGLTFPLPVKEKAIGLESVQGGGVTWTAVPRDGLSLSLPSHVLLLTPLCQPLNSPTVSWYRELIH